MNHLNPIIKEVVIGLRVMLVTPPNGWQAFDENEAVLKMINSSLDLNGLNSIWQFYQLSENCSIWCSDEIEATNQLQMTLESTDNGYSIKSLGIELTNNSSQYFKQLYRLKKNLKSEFNIRDCG